MSNGHIEPLIFKPQQRLCHIHSSDELADLLGLDSNVSTLSVQAFDPRGEYKEVVQAVEAAGNKKTKIYKVIYGRTRAEYYVLSLDEQGGKVVGVRATAVES